jgi:DegV family protein with EDD domain
MQIRYLDGPRFRRGLLAACEYARGQRAELNRINVFPVPDGDTGTNLALTLSAIADHLRKNRAQEIGAVAYEAAQGAVVGARGNCGMMLSHFLLGFAESVGSRERIDASEFGTALVAGSEKLYAALERPVEGTILTVMRDAAQAARSFMETDFVPLVAHIVDEAKRSLAQTPDLLPALKEAGVVDAGAKGFVGLLEGVELFVSGDLPDTPAPEEDDTGPDAASLAEYPEDDEQYRFCTEALVRGDSLPTQTAAREQLRHLGDSLIVIRAGDVLKLHIHTDAPESVFEYLRTVGTLVTHKAEDMRAQHDAVERAAAGHVRLARRPVSIVTDSACDLSEEIVRAHGIHVIPMSLVTADRVYRDGIDITASEFHERLRSGGELPTTSQPAPAAFIETYQRALEEGETVVGISVSSTLSGTLHAAEAAATRVEGGDIHLVDSLGASLLQGLLVLKAAELAELGWDPAAIVVELRRVRAQSGLLLTIATFDRLLASGRVDRGRALLGTMLALKPILGLDASGVVVRYGQALGARRARAELLRILREQIPRGASKVRFGIAQVGIPEIVDEVARALRSEYGKDVEILSAPVTPVIATHVGIGAWALAFLVED